MLMVMMTMMMILRMMMMMIMIMMMMMMMMMMMIQVDGMKSAGACPSIPMYFIPLANTNTPKLTSAAAKAELAPPSQEAAAAAALGAPLAAPRKCRTQNTTKMAAEAVVGAAPPSP